MTSSWRVFLCLVISVAWGDDVFADSDAHRQAIERILLRHEEPGYSEKLGSLRAYARDSGLSMSDMAAEIESIASATLGVADPDRGENLRLAIACWGLGELKEPRSTNVLIKAAASRSIAVRCEAMSAYVKVAKEDCLSLAEDIVSKKDIFEDAERFRLYRAMAPYAKRSDDQRLDRKRDKVRKFLIEAAGNESYAGAAKALDEVLLSVLPFSYETSVQRYMLAMRFRNCGAPLSEYFGGVVDEIENVPVRDRKDVLAGNE